MLEHFTWGKLINPNYNNLSHEDHQKSYGDYYILTVSNLAFTNKAEEIATTIGRPLKEYNGFQTELSYLRQNADGLFIYTHFYSVYQDDLRADKVCIAPFHCFVFDENELIKMDYKPWRLTNFFCKNIYKNQVIDYNSNPVLTWKPNFSHPKLYHIDMSYSDQSRTKVMPGKLSKSGIWNITDAIRPETFLNNMEAQVRYSLICEGIAFNFNDDFKLPPSFIKLRFCNTSNPAEGNIHKAEELALIKSETILQEKETKNSASTTGWDVYPPGNIETNSPNTNHDLKNQSKDINLLQAKIDELESDKIITRNKINDLKKQREEKKSIVTDINTSRYKKLSILLCVLVLLAGVIFFFIGKSVAPKTIGTNEVENLKNSIKDLEENIKVNKSIIKKLEEGMDTSVLSLNHKIVALEEKYIEAQKIYEDQKNRNGALINDNNLLLGKYNNEVKIYNDLITRFNDLNTQYNALNSERSGHNNAIKAKNDEIKAKSDQINTLNTQMNIVNNQLTQEKQSNEELKIQIAALKKDESGQPDQKEVKKNKKNKDKNKNNDDIMQPPSENN